MLNLAQSHNKAWGDGSTSSCRASLSLDTVPIDEKFRRPNTFSQKQITFPKNVMFTGMKTVNSIVILKTETFTLLITNDYGIKMR
jgi:hypothetical protein